MTSLLIGLYMYNYMYVHLFITSGQKQITNVMSLLLFV